MGERVYVASGGITVSLCCDPCGLYRHILLPIAAAELSEHLSAWVRDHRACIDVGLECPCCGDVGAWGDAHGLFRDGDPLVCGCPGMVSVDAETEPYISIDDDAEECGHG